MELARAHGIETTFNIMFAGNMGTVQALDKVVEAAELTEKELPDVRFVFIGSGSERDKLEQLVQTKKLSNVVLLPRVPVDAMPRILALASAMLVHLRDEFPFDVTIPSKTQEALGIGKPVLMAVRGEASELVQQAGAGVIAEPLNPRSIADAAGRLRSMPPDELQAMGMRGKTFYESNMSFDIVVDQIEAMLKEAVGGK
jgi:glycosyltransferase involved in cell wall biosynthesis